MFADIKAWAINALGLSAAGSFDESPVADSRALSVTAITAREGAALLQCWQIEPAFATSSQAGILGASVLPLGVNTTASLVSIPAGFNGGLHVAPALQYVAFLQGTAYVTTESNADAAIPKYQAEIRGGRGSESIIFAADTAEVSTNGHYTTYGSDSEVLAVPIKLGRMPEHSVLHDGPCLHNKIDVPVEVPIPVEKEDL